MNHAMAELRAFDKTAKRLLAMPKPELVELTTATDDDPWDRFAAGDDPGSRRKWRNDVATAMVHELIEDAGVKIVTSRGIAVDEVDVARSRLSPAAPQAA